MEPPPRPVTLPAPGAPEAAWHAALESLEGWCFGGPGSGLEDPLAALVVRGLKTATSGWYQAYQAEDEPLPRVGEVSYVRDSRGRPVCVVELTEVEVHPFLEVDADLARDEGEGDRSLAYWRRAHEAFFRSCEEEVGLRWDPETQDVVCERFRVLHVFEPFRPRVRVRDLARGYSPGGPARRLGELLVGRRGAPRWALEGVDLELLPGEAVGVVGANGAGKSTLLEVLAGTSPPCRGELSVRGRVAAILELGTGLEPEFSARENIALLGTLHGVPEDQMRQREASILEFAELTEFADAPVRTYSTGMRMRLAFATLTATEPDVLLLDEALSVGDLGFRNRCMARIRELRERGVSLLVVSHDLASLQVLCDRLVWLDRGRVRAEGDPLRVLQDYQAEQVPDTPGDVPQESSGVARILELALDLPEEESGVVPLGGDAPFRFRLEALEALEGATLALSVYRRDGDWVTGRGSDPASCPPLTLAPGERARGRVVLERTPLAPGEYRVCLGVYAGEGGACLALSGLTAPFSVRSARPVWGRFEHPVRFSLETESGDSEPGTAPEAPGA